MARNICRRRRGEKRRSQSSLWMAAAAAAAAAAQTHPCPRQASHTRARVWGTARHPPPFASRMRPLHAARRPPPTQHQAGVARGELVAAATNSRRSALPFVRHSLHPAADLSRPERGSALGNKARPLRPQGAPRSPGRPAGRSPPLSAFCEAAAGTLDAPPAPRRPGRLLWETTRDTPCFLPRALCGERRTRRRLRAPLGLRASRPAQTSSADRGAPQNGRHDCGAASLPACLPRAGGGVLQGVGQSKVGVIFTGGRESGEGGARQMRLSDSSDTHTHPAPFPSRVSLR